MFSVIFESRASTRALNLISRRDRPDNAQAGLVR